MANLGGFGLTVQDLEILCQSRDPKKLNEHEGVQGLEKKLRTNLQKGLSADEAKDGYAKRKEAYVLEEECASIFKASY